MPCFYLIVSKTWTIILNKFEFNCKIYIWISTFPTFSNDNKFDEILRKNIHSICYAIAMPILEAVWETAEVS